MAAISYELKHVCKQSGAAMESYILLMVMLKHQCLCRWDVSYCKRNFPRNVERNAFTSDFGNTYHLWFDQVKML